MMRRSGRSAPAAADFTGCDLTGVTFAGCRVPWGHRPVAGHRPRLLAAGDGSDLGSASELLEQLRQDYDLRLTAERSATAPAMTTTRPPRPGKILRRRASRLCPATAAYRLTSRCAGLSSRLAAARPVITVSRSRCSSSSGESPSSASSPVASLASRVLTVRRSA